MVSANTPSASTPPKLLDQVREKIKSKHYSIHIEKQKNNFDASYRDSSPPC